MNGRVMPISAAPGFVTRPPSKWDAEVAVITQLGKDQCYFLPLEGRYAQHNAACQLRSFLRKRGVRIQTRMSPEGLYVCRKSVEPSYTDSGPVGAILDERGQHE